MSKRHRRGLATSPGFTLLEVIVAMAITGFVLGGLFSLVAGSKQLTWRAESNLERATQIRARTNFALLQNEYADVEPILANDDYRVESTGLLEAPVRMTQPSIHAIGRFEVRNSERDEVITGTRWVELDVPR